MNDVTLQAFQDELEKIASNPGFNRGTASQFYKATKKVVGAGLGKGVKAVSDKYVGNGPIGRAAMLGAGAGIIGGGVSGLFDGRGDPTIGKRLKRGLKRGAQWGISGAGIGAMTQAARGLENG